MDSTIEIEITEAKIDLTKWQNWLESSSLDGAVVTFTGKVRQDQKTDPIQSLILEHYPAMTEKALTLIAQQAQKRFSLTRVVIVHRVGCIDLNQRIVFVGVSAPHRLSAFEGAEFIMDLLKNEAPFWKKQKDQQAETWIAAKKSDQQQLKKWI